MNFQEAEKAYKDLKAQHDANKLSDADFETKVGELKLQDTQGRWWQIGVQTGEWYVHDGQKWNKAKPPVTPIAPPPSPTSMPEEKPDTAAPAGDKKPASKGGLPARFLSATPPGRAGGLSTPVLIGVIVVVAIVGIAILVGGYFVLSGQLGGPTPRATVIAAKSPTLPVVVPSPSVPTLAPTVAATNTPLPQSSPAVTTTASVTRTVVTTPAAPRPTATRRPATPATPTKAVPTPTKAPNVPPGVYVTKVRLDPAQPTFNTSITFHITFLNSTAKLGPSTWLVKLFKCEAACTTQELQTSIGETPKSTKEILGGTTELTAGPWSVGLGACNYVASPYYVDDLGNLVPFQGVDGSPRVYFNFKLCQ